MLVELKNIGILLAISVRSPLFFNPDCPQSSARISASSAGASSGSTSLVSSSSVNRHCEMSSKSSRGGNVIAAQAK